MIIKVTAKCIKRSWKQDPTRCPVARAFRVLGFKKISVIGDSVDFTTPDGLVLTGVLLPMSAQRFIKAFDYDEEVKPFSFRIKATV
jgi:hypothetical protein